MKRINSKAALLKKRVRKIQGRAKFVGVLYLLGTIGLLAIAAVLPILSGTCIVDVNSAQFPVLTFYQPIVDLFGGGTEAFESLTAVQVIDIIVVALFAIMLLVMVINVLRGLGKLGWLFKRRASYTNGFNRNMYAMDDLAKLYSSSLSALVVLHLFIFLFSGGTIATDGAESAVGLTMNAYIALGAGLGVHFFCGLIGGTVTLFTTGDRIEEEVRENGLFVFFVRNLVQLVAVAAIVYFFLQESALLVKVQELLKLLVEDKAPFAEINFMEYLLVAVELVAWLFIVVLTKHATAATEFNRDGMAGSGMRNFAVFSFLTALVLAAEIALPMLGIGVTEVATELNQNLLIAAVVAFVAFLLDCIIKSRPHEDNYDDVDMEAYFREGDSKYNNTII